MEMLKEGIGFRGIGRLLGVSFETIRNWAKKMVQKVCNVQITEEIEDVQIDEMCITIKKKELKNGSGLLILQGKNEFSIFKLEIDQQEPLINSLQELIKGSKSSDIPQIIMQVTKN